jgi:hypothetical protein
MVICSGHVSSESTVEQQLYRLYVPATQGSMQLRLVVDTFEIYVPTADE